MAKNKRRVPGKDITRRTFVGGAAGTVAAGSIVGFPAIVEAADPLRTIGLGVSIIKFKARLRRTLYSPSMARRLATAHFSARA